MDSQSLILVLALSNFLLVGILLARRLGRDSQAELPALFARGCQAAGWTLILLQHQVHGIFSLVLGHGLLLCGVAFEAGRMWGLAEYSHWRRYLLPLAALMTGVYAGEYASGAHTALQTRVAVVLLAVLHLSTGVAWLVLARRGEVLARFISLLSLALAAGLLGTAIPGVYPLDDGHMPGMALLLLVLLALLHELGAEVLQSERHLRQLQRLEVVDTLTDAPNRRGFYNALTPWLALARRPGQSAALIKFDLDHFKRVNDTYGHQVGDVVLKSVVDVGKKQLRDSDLLGRLGGEEFAVLLPRTSLADAMLVAERMRQAIAQMPIKTERALIYVTASLGVTALRPEDSLVSLFKRADEAVRAAKEQGRNAVCEGTPNSPVVT